MPEGDTIYKVAQLLRGHLVGGGPVRFLVARQAPVAGDVDSVESHGKQLLIALRDGRLLRSHLGLHGSWHSYPAGVAWQKPRRQARIEIRTSQRVLVCFNAKEVEWLQQGSVRFRELLRRIGPDLMAGDFDIEELLRRIQSYLPPETPVVDLLLDQRIAAGVGNVFKSEILFLAHCSPRATLAELTRDDLEQLFALARQLLLANKLGHSRVTRLEARSPEQDQLWVYGRVGEPCHRCDARISMEKLGKHLRPTYFCSNCQNSTPRTATDKPDPL